MWPFTLFHSSFIFYLHLLYVNYNVIYSSCIQYSTFYFGHGMSEHKHHYYMMWVFVTAFKDKILQSNNYIKFVQKLKVMCTPLLLYQPRLIHHGSIKHCIMQHCQLISDITPYLEQRLWAPDKIHWFQRHSQKNEDVLNHSNIWLKMSITSL